MSIFPYRAFYRKTGRMRFLGHHDVMRLWTRALRRAGLPIRFTEGFTPRPVLSMPLALAVGLESLEEVLEFELSEAIPAEEVRTRLNAQLPGEGEIEILRVEPFERSERLRIAAVELRFDLDRVPEDLPSRIERVLAADSVTVRREGGGARTARRVDVRPFLEELRPEPGGFRARVKVTDRGTARGPEIAGALGIPEETVRRVVKIRTHLEKPSP